MSDEATKKLEAAHVAAQQVARLAERAVELFMAIRDHARRVESQLGVFVQSSRAGAATYGDPEPLTSTLREVGVGLFDAVDGAETFARVARALAERVSTEN